MPPPPPRLRPAWQRSCARAAYRDHPCLPHHAPSRGSGFHPRLRDIAHCVPFPAPPPQRSVVGRLSSVVALLASPAPRSVAGSHLSFALRAPQASGGGNPGSYVLLFLTCRVRNATNVASSRHHRHRLWSTLRTARCATPPAWPQKKVFVPSCTRQSPKSPSRSANQGQSALHKLPQTCTKVAPNRPQVAPKLPQTCTRPAARTHS
jgi:hypothetical protein